VFAASTYIDGKNEPIQYESHDHASAVPSRLPPGTRSSLVHGYETPMDGKQNEMSSSSMDSATIDQGNVASMRAALMSPDAKLAKLCPEGDIALTTASPTSSHYGWRGQMY
jgi:hypothetical protein